MITGTAYLDLNEDGIHQPGEPGLARVVVSNGRDVTRTDDEGTYQLPDADAEFVFVSLPSGHRLTSPFYHRIGSTSAESFDFELALDDQPAAFTFIHYTDMHLADGHQPVEGFREFIAEVNAMAPPPAFAIGTGDITLQGGAGEVYAKEIDAINVPLYHTMGNHEMLVGQPDPKAAYKALFGPTYYSFNYSGVHFVVMDGHQADPTQEGWKNVIGIVSDRELDWLRADLQQIEAGTPIIGLIHIPLVSTFTERRGLHPLSSPWWEVVNYDEAIDVLAAYNTRLVLQGHMHENERIRYRGIDFITIGAVCGGWWRDPLNPDGSPRGYRIVSVVGGEVASRYKSTGFPYDYQLRIEFPEEEKPKVAQVPIGVNVFDGTAETRVEYAIDRGAWQPMTFNPTNLTDTTRSCPHYWQATVRTENLSVGTHLLKVRAILPNGDSYTECASIEVNGAGNRSRLQG